MDWKIVKGSEVGEIDPERVPIPEFTAVVDRGLKENKADQVWDWVFTIIYIYI